MGGFLREPKAGRLTNQTAGCSVCDKFMRFWFLLIILTAMVPWLKAQVQTGPRFVVTTLIDYSRGAAMVGDCSLREAIRAATLSGQPAVIVFADGLSGELALNPRGGALFLSTPVSILGPGARQLSINGGGRVPVFTVSGGPHLISGLTIRGGTSAGNGGYSGGGGIMNEGSLVVEECTITGNEAVAITSSHVWGGGIFNKGALSLIRCAVSGNKADASNTSYRSGTAFGGGVYVSDGSLTAVSTTFHSNLAQGGDLDGAAYGAIYVRKRASAFLRNCTVSGNGALARNAASVAGVFSDGTCTVFSSVIAGNHRMISGFPMQPDVSGSFISQGHNLIGSINGYPETEEVVGAFVLPSDITGTAVSMQDPLLGTLQNNGGPTDSMLPSAGSPLIDRGKISPGHPVDQRRLSRIVDDMAIADAEGGDGTDIGAVERGASTTPPKVEFTRIGGLIRLGGARGTGYIIEHSETLGPPWTPLDGTFLSDGAGNLMALDSFGDGPLPSRRFYRGVPR